MVDLAHAAVLLGARQHLAHCWGWACPSETVLGGSGGPLRPITRHLGFSTLLHSGDFKLTSSMRPHSLQGRREWFLPRVSKLRCWLPLRADSGQFLLSHPPPSGPFSVVPGWPAPTHGAHTPTPCCDTRNHDVQDKQHPHWQPLAAQLQPTQPDGTLLFQDAF